MLDPAKFPNAIAYAFEAVGGIGAAAKACDRSCQALHKWRQAACLPRTDYSGETNYAQRLSAAARQNGHSFDAAWLLEASVPKAAA